MLRHGMPVKCGTYVARVCAVRDLHDQNAASDAVDAGDLFMQIGRARERTRRCRTNGSLRACSD